MSVGTRLTKIYNDNMESITTLVLNPVMGHLSSSYTTHLQPTLVMTTKFDFNVYSYESDVSVGLKISPSISDIDIRIPQTLNARFSLSNVFSVTQRTLLIICRDSEWDYQEMQSIFSIRLEWILVFRRATSGLPWSFFNLN